MLTNTHTVIRLLTLCRDAAVRTADTDTVNECEAVAASFCEADWIADKEQHDIVMAACEAKALVIIEAYVTVMADQLKEQGL